MKQNKNNPVSCLIIYLVMMSIIVFTLVNNSITEVPVLYATSILLAVILTMWMLTVIGLEFKRQEAWYKHESLMIKYKEYQRNGGKLTYLAWLNNQGKHIGK